MGVFYFRGPLICKLDVTEPFQYHSYANEWTRLLSSMECLIYFRLVVVVEHKHGGQFEIATQNSGKLDEKLARTRIRSAGGRG